MKLILWSTINKDLARLEKLIDETRRLTENPENYWLKLGRTRLEKAKRLILDGAGRSAVREELDDAVRCVAHPWFERKDGHHVLALFGRREFLNEMFWGWAPCHCWGMRGLCARNLTIRKFCWKLGLFAWL